MSWKNLKEEKKGLEEIEKHVESLKTEKTVDVETEKRIPKPSKPKKYYVNLTNVFSTVSIMSFLLLFLLFYLYHSLPIFTIIAILLGMVLFLPIGFLLGWVLLDTYMRCKILRFISKKNYGIVHIVSRGKRIITKIKDFDGSFIWIQDGIWYIDPEAVYVLDKEPVKHPINPDHINYISGVPVLYIDLDTAQPLSFYKITTPHSPKSLGGALKGWASVQKKKAIIGQKRQTQLIYLILLVAIAIAIFLSYQNYVFLQNKILPLLESLKSQSNVVIPP